MLKIIFCGDRHWEDIGWITQVMSAIKSNIGKFTVIEGEANGADYISRHVAKNVLNLPVLPVLADWDRLGRAAGPIRNTVMLIDYEADATVAFHLDIRNSKGTADMIKQTRAAGRPAWLCTDGPEALMDFISKLKEIQRRRNEKSKGFNSN